MPSKYSMIKIDTSIKYEMSQKRCLRATHISQQHLLLLLVLYCGTFIPFAWLSATNVIVKKKSLDGRDL
jgi:hypothetical protein